MGPRDFSHLMTWPLTILHLSDLHFGPHGRFAGEDTKALADRFHQAIEQARKEMGWSEPVGLCIVTGDIAEAARPREYEEAREFFEALVGRLGLARPRVIFVPGNHDVSWHITQRIELDRDEQGFGQAEFEKRIREEKFRNFEQFLARFYDQDPMKLPGVQALGHGAFVHAFPDERLSVAVLNSCERESHLQQGGALSQAQAQALMGQWKQADTAQWIKLVAIHHNPVATVPANVKSWVTYLEAQTGKLKPETIRHFAADAVGLDGGEYLRAVAEDARIQLILHGHHHAAAKEAWHWTKDKGHTLVLSAGSWGLRPDKLPGDQPNMMHLIRMDPGNEQVQSVLRVFTPRARAEGHVQSGHFTVDPANAKGTPLQLSVPDGFREKVSAPDPASVEAGKALDFIQEYRTRLKKRFERWDLRGVGAVQAGGAGKPIEATLDDMYLPLRLAEDFNPEKLGEGSSLEPSMLIARQRPLVVRGSAGSGKTTWMRWTFRRLVELPGAIPFMIELRRLAYVWNKTEARGAERTLDAYLREAVAESGASGWEDALPQVFRTRTGPRPVLFVDGWDELGELGDELRDKLMGFLEAHPRVLAVVSSRPYGASRPTGSEGFEVLDLQPLSDEEILLFTQRFHLRVYGEDVVPAEESAQRFSEALEGSPEALSLARTPLLLTMMLLISRDRPLPDKRHLLYEECLRNLLSARPDQGEKEGVRLHQGQWRPVDSAERWRAVAALAFKMQTAGYKHSRSQLVGTSSELEALLPEGWKREEKRGFLAWLVGAAGVLVDRADETLSFAHLSFQEYLTADHLAATREGDAARIEICQELMNEESWWETLRLWAAVLEDRNPAHLLPVLRQLLQSRPSGFWLAGTFFADGLGDEVFGEWCRALTHRFHLSEEHWAEMSARAWRASRQVGRRQELTKWWPQFVAEWSWLTAALARTWRDAAHLDASGKDAFEEISTQHREGPGIGRSRVLSGLHPLWPGSPEEITLLQLLPSQRAVKASQLQRIISLGGSLEELARAAKRTLIQIPEPEVRKTAQQVVRDLSLNFSRAVAEELALYWARYWSADWARYWAPEILRAWFRDYAWYWEGDEGLISAQSDSEWEWYWEQFWASPPSSGWAHDLAHEWAAEAGYSTLPEWAVDWMCLEIASSGRALSRAVFRQTWEVSDLRQKLLRAACRHSPSRARDRLLSTYSLKGDPLWPALARHLARCSTAEDRALLIDLAQHPEKREEPLFSGLKYYVRGDLVFEDGSEMTIDELCDELGLPRLPYLEDRPPVLSLE